jgi:hypothetical protein
MRTIFQELDDLFFGEPGEDTVITLPPPSPEDQREAGRYDSITDIRDKRRQILWDIKNGNVEAGDYPTVLGIYANYIDKLPDGKFVIRGGANSPKDKERFTKTINFISSGKIDALSSAGTPDVKKIITSVAEEILRQIPTENDHPTRKLLALIKNGTVDESINFFLKKHHYDIFGDNFIMYIKPLIINKTVELRKSEVNMKRRGIQEEFQRAIRNIFLG